MEREGTADAASATPLRVALLLDSPMQPRWVLRTIETIQSSSYARVVGAAIGRGIPAGRQGWSHPIARFYAWMDRRFFFRGSVAAQLNDVRPVLDGIPVRDGRDSWPEATNIDVVLRFGSPGVEEQVRPRFGTWSVVLPQGLAEFMTQAPTVTAYLEADGEVIGFARTGTDQISLRRGMDRVCRRTVAMVTSALARLQIEQSVIPIESPPRTDDGDPSALQMLLGTAGAAFRYVRRHLQRKLTREQWLIAIRFRDAEHDPDPNADLDEFRIIVPPRDRLWADPFVITHEGRVWVFMEELVYRENRGVIAVIEVRRDGTRSTPRRVIERPYHLSYPCVFRWQDEFYMVPETSANGTVELYRCRSFPYEWELAQILLRGIQAVDATVFEHDGLWWMFFSTSTDPAAFDELHLYHAPSPRGPWTPHRRNPIASDAIGGRCAGRPFRYRGKLYRAAQVGTRRYGEAIQIREIVRLTTAEVVEREVSFIHPRWMRGLVATHTLNLDNHITVVDGARRLWLRRRSAGGPSMSDTATGETRRP